MREGIDSLCRGRMPRDHCVFNGDQRTVEELVVKSNTAAEEVEDIILKIGEPADLRGRHK